MEPAKWFPGIRDQGSEGACSGFSTAENREVLWGKVHQKMLDDRRSPSYLYGRTRIAEGTFPEDAGATLADEFAVLHSFGVCSEDDMPFDEDPAEPIPNIADVDAAAFRIEQACSVDMRDPEKAKQVLAAGFAISIGVAVYDSFESVKSDGLLPIPDPDKENLLGGHAILLLGYDDNCKCYYGANSWGKSWGHNGFFWMPYNYEIEEGWTAVR